jgi:hypothetical protein
MSEHYYTIQALNRDLELRNYQVGPYRRGLDGIEIGSLPPALGARTLPPAGPFTTASDVAPHGSNANASEPMMTPLVAAAAFVAAYFLFLPMVL